MIERLKKIDKKSYKNEGERFLIGKIEKIIFIMEKQLNHNLEINRS